MKCSVCRQPFEPRATGRCRRFCSGACRQMAYRRRHGRSVHFLSKTAEWGTPADLFTKLTVEYGGFDLDVCATVENAKCSRFFTREEDGLQQPWTGRCWCNPPYGRTIRDWLRKAWQSVSEGGAELVVCLIPARTDTAWWHSYVSQGEVRFLPGRIKFVGGQHAAPFPSAVVIFRNAQCVTKPGPESIIKFS